jgi:hypothetical protein
MSKQRTLGSEGSKGFKGSEGAQECAWSTVVEHIGAMKRNEALEEENRRLKAELDAAKKALVSDWARWSVDRTRSCHVPSSLHPTSMTDQPINSDLQRNPWLRDVVALCEHESYLGAGGVDMMADSFAEILHAERIEQIEEMTWAQMQSIVPDLQALGFWVTAFPELGVAGGRRCAIGVQWFNDRDFLGSELDEFRRFFGDTLQRYVPTGPPLPAFMSYKSDLPHHNLPHPY